MARKISQKEWEWEVKRAMKLREINKHQMKNEKFSYYQNYLKKIMPLPYVLGIGAAIALYVIYGWQEFLKFLLSWTVSTTIIATFAYHIWKHYENKL